VLLGQAVAVKRSGEVVSETLLAARRSFRLRGTNAARARRGATVIATAKPSDVQRLRELGAAETIDYTRQDIAGVIVIVLSRRGPRALRPALGGSSDSSRETHPAK
jgi:hypothetical protein